MKDLNTSKNEETRTMSRKAELLASLYAFIVLILLFIFKTQVNEQVAGFALFLIITGMYVIHRIFPQLTTKDT